MEVAGNIATNVAVEIIVNSIKKAATQVRYLFCFNDIVETLEKEKQDLIREQGSIEERAKKAHRKSETMSIEVQKWLEHAENLIKEVDKLQKETGMHSVAGWCPNCFKRYRLGRRAAKKTTDLKQLKGNCNFAEFSRLATLRGIEYYSSEGFISFESRKQAFDQIIEALKDERIHRIGVHGMGGCGKTTLVKEVGKEAEKLGLFEKVIIVVVSNHPDIRKIQSSLAGSVGFKFEIEENESERARRLSMALSNWGRILVILDDVWEKPNFEVIGIPSNCCILLTTRNISVCNTMECEEKVSLLLLNEAESWSLFQNCAGVTENNFDTFKALGQEIANECKGLPVAVAAVAGSLMGKGLAEWKDTRDKLRDSEQVDIEPSLRNPYKCLQVSYDNLIREEFKSLFLLCSLFPEDFEILGEILTRFAMGLGLFGKIHSNERTRNEVSVAINKLIDSCLLLNGDEINTFKMHDLVHDIALQIAKTKNMMIIGKEKSKKELEEHSILEDDQIRYLFLDTDEFPPQLHCPKLQCLLININLQDEVVAPDDYFNEMKDLRVLALFCDIYESQIFHLQKSIKSLTNLHCLMLKKWDLSDMSFVDSLSSIEDLSLFSCSFDELPDTVANLKHLRLLNLVRCKIGSNPYEVIQKCSKLEELYFVDNEYPKREEEGEYNFEFCGKLQRYHINIGENSKKFDDENYSIRRYLSVEDFEAVSSYTTIVDLVRKAEVLCLGGIDKGCKSIIPDFVEKMGKGMTELTRLIVHDSNEVESLVDMTISFHHIGTVFSNLTHLEISRMQHLKELFLGLPHHGLLQKLEELHIYKCNQLKHIIANEPEIIPDSDNPKSHNSVFPKLKVITIEDCKELEYLMPIFFAKDLLQLEKFHITKASQLKYVFSPSNYKAEDQSHNQNLSELHIIRLQALRYLTLDSLSHIVNICPENYYPVYPSLDSMILSDCPKLNILHDEFEFKQLDQTIRKNGIVLCNLTKLELSKLNSLETLFPGPAHLAGFEKLQELSIRYCGQLKHLIASDAEKINSEGSNVRSYNSIFSQLKVISLGHCEHLEYLMPVSFARGLLKLEELKVGYSSQLKYVFGQFNDKAEGQSHNQNLSELHIIKLQALKYLTLYSLSHIVNICPESYYPVCPSLDSMILSDCPQLNMILDESEFKQLHQTIGKNGIIFCNLTKLHLSKLNSLETLFLGPTHLAGFENLQEISISYCSQLKHLIASDAEKTNSEGSNVRSYNSIFSQLKVISVRHCEHLEYLMPVSFARGLLKLENLNVGYSSQLKYVFGQSNDKVEGQSHNQNLSELHIIRLQALKYLTLYSLSHIVNICLENYYPVCPSLDSMILSDCPQLNMILDESEFKQLHQTIGKNGIVFCNLTKLHLSKLNSLETLFLGPAHLTGFEKLQEISISYCSQLKHLIASDAEKINSEGSNVRSYNSIFSQLKVISLGHCQHLEYLMPVSFARGLLKLEELRVEYSSQLKFVFGQSNDKAKGQSHNQNLSELHIIKLQALKYLTLDSFSHIINICPESYYLVCPSLDSMILMDCPQLNIILDESEFKQLHQTIGKNGIVFCNLTKLELFELNSLETLFLGPTHLAGFEKLQEISISCCSQLKHLIASDAEKINSEGNIVRSYNSIFSQLKVISVRHCQHLEYFMPVSFARGLLKLEKLKVEYSSQLKYVFGQSNDKAEGQSHNQNLSELHIIKLQALNYLTLDSLPHIFSICPESYYLVCPSLDSMILMDCPQLNIILDVLEFKQLDQTIGKELGPAMISCVQNLKSCRNMEVDGQEVIAGLEDLELCDLPELKYIWSNTRQILSLEILRILRIKSCRNLEVVFSTSILRRSLNQLMLLEITQCEDLQQIIEVDVSNPYSGQVCFPKLITLIVQRCHKLKCLFSFSTSIELPKLKFLIIEEASGLEEVIACEKGNRKEQVEVEFPELEFVLLIKLPSLSEVYRGIELETVRCRVVHHCPKLSLMSSDTPEEFWIGFKEYHYDLEIIHRLYSDASGDASEIELDSPKAISTSYNWLKEKEDHSEELGNDIKNKHHQENFDSPSEMSTSMPEAQFKASQSEDKSCNWGEFLTLSLSFETKMVEESAPEKTNLHFDPKKLHSEVGELVQNVPKNEQLLMAEQNKVVELPKRTDVTSEPLNIGVSKASPSNRLHDFTTSSQLSFSAEVPLPISTPSPTSLYFSDTPNVEGDLLSGIDLNKPPKEFFEVIEQRVQVINTSSNHSKFTTMSSPRLLPIPVHTTTSLLADEQPMSGASLMDQQEALKQTEIHFQTSEETKRTNKTAEASDREGLQTEETGIAPLSIDLETRNPSPGPLVLWKNPSPQVNQSMQGCEAQTDRNDNCNKSQEFLTPEQEVSSIASLNFIEVVKESTKEFDGVLDLKIPTVTTLNDSKLTTRTSPSTLAIPLHTIPPSSSIKETMEASDEEDRKSAETEIAPFLTDLKPRNLSSGPSLLGTNPPLQTIKGSVEEVPTLGDAKMLSSTQSKATSSVPNILQGQVRVNQTKNYTGEDVKEDPINPEEFKDVDLVSLLQSMEEDSNTQAPMLSVSRSAAKNLTAEDNLVSKALADLQVSLKAPLKDIASTAAAILRFENALNFLSCYSFEDDAVSYGLKAVIDSLYQDFPCILSSFKQASAIIDRFTVLEEKQKSMKAELPRRKELAVTLIEKISETEMSMAEIQQKEASLMEQISRLQVELNNTGRRKNECEGELSSLQEQKNKCVAETIEFRKEFESVKEHKSQMIEDHRKSQRELFLLNNKWSALCSQFEQNHSATRRS